MPVVSISYSGIRTEVVNGAVERSTTSLDPTITYAKVREQTPPLTHKDNQEPPPHLWPPLAPKIGSPAVPSRGAPQTVDRLGGTIKNTDTPSPAELQANHSGPPCWRCQQPTEVRRHKHIGPKQRRTAGSKHSSNSPARNDFRLTLELKADIRALRGILKLLLRKYGLRCVSIVKARP